MADTVKISQLPIATTISGGDVLPVVQGGVTKQVDVNNIFSAVNSLAAATTISGGEYMLITQSGISKKMDVLDIFDTVSIPGNNSLEGAWLCDELPEYPDDPAGTTYIQDEWATVDGWVGFADSSTVAVAAAGGSLVVTKIAGTYNYARAIKDIAAGTLKTYRVKITAIKALTSVALLGTVGGVSGTVLIEFGAMSAGQTLTKDVYVAGDVTRVFCNSVTTIADSGIVFSIDFIYIGTGAYATPVVDNSGNGLHLEAHGVTPDGAGNLIFDGVNDRLVSTNVLTTMPDVLSLSIWYNGELKSGNQYLANYRVQSATVGHFGLLRGNYSNSLYISYASGVADSLLMFGSIFDSHNSCLIELQIDWLTGAVKVFRDGVQYDVTKNMTTPVKPMGGSYLHFGSYQGTSYFLKGTIGNILYYSCILPIQEVRRAYLGLLPVLPYGLINWQNEYEISTTVTTSSFLVNTTSGYVIPQGKYQFSATSPSVQLQFLSGSTWYGASYLSGQVCADGVNVRAYNPTASGVTVYYRKLEI